MRYWKSLKYKNITFFLVSIAVAIAFSRFEGFQSFLLSLGKLGYLGAFVAGVLFVSTFSVTTSAVILLVLSEKLSPIPLGVTAALGAVLGDFTIFKFVRDNLINEVEQIYEKVDHNDHIKKILHTKYFSWMLPVLGAIIIASPLPDEVGVSLMGISKMKTYKFLILSFTLNLAGIFLVIFLSRFIKP